MDDQSFHSHPSPPRGLSIPFPAFAPIATATPRAHASATPPSVLVPGLGHVPHRRHPSAHLSIPPPAAREHLRDLPATDGSCAAAHEAPVIYCCCWRFYLCRSRPQVVFLIDLLRSVSPASWTPSLLSLGRFVYPVSRVGPDFPAAKIPASPSTRTNHVVF
ncbi:hypothetical protein B0T18DRAFT_75380 [Schizothecium vesticola]|uniref:Uncharacterized protein n=1 Tax=Schizothecium vesticola TaxID=314040 RepID=A0AA40F6F4_9PEZI|nr:hypothetical protein B0T18DRAFT_75380 [Schizothecium vesticola]